VALLGWLVGCHERRKAETVAAKLNSNLTQPQDLGTQIFTPYLGDVSQPQK
jgi:hypothetical protein